MRPFSVRPVAAAVLALVTVSTAVPVGAAEPPVAEATTVDGIVAAVDYTESDADVLRLYRAFFSRDPDDDGAVYWVTQRRGESTVEDLTFGFANSAEFEMQYGQLSNDDFLTVVYDNMLGRIADQDGFDYWLGELTSGRLDQPGVVRWVTENAEFENRYPFAPDTSRADRVADFFRSTEAICRAFSERVGNPPPESSLFTDLTVVNLAGWPKVVIFDGVGTELIVDMGGPTAVVTSIEGADFPLPRVYSFGCPEDVFLGTLDE